MKKVNWSREKLIEAVQGSVTYSDILGKLGLSIYGRNTDTLKQYLQQYEIVFVSAPHKKRDYRNQSLSNDQVFVENSSTRRSVVRDKILKQGLIEYKCSECGLDPVWNGKPITLQLEHKNGIPNDHRLENLTFLCPNCHSQTDTWAGKGSKVHNIELKPKPDPKPRKVSVLASLTVAELTLLISQKTFGEIGKMFGVSDNAVRRYCKKLGIEMPGQGYRKLLGCS